jgi:hypothetical protein
MQALRVLLLLMAMVSHGVHTSTSLVTKEVCHT